MTTKKNERSWGDAFYEDPDAAVGHLAQHIEKNIEQKYLQEKGRQTFFQTFYESHPELKGDDALVNEVINANIDELAKLRVDDGSTYDRIADLAHKRIRASAERHGYRKQLRDEDVMRGSPEHGHAYRERGPQRPTSLGDLIRAKRQRRHEVFHGSDVD